MVLYVLDVLLTDLVKLLFELVNWEMGAKSRVTEEIKGKWVGQEVGEDVTDGVMWLFSFSRVVVIDS